MDTEVYYADHRSFTIELCFSLPALHVTLIIAWLHFCLRITLTPVCEYPSLDREIYFHSKAFMWMTRTEPNSQGVTPGTMEHERRMEEI